MVAALEQVSRGDTSSRCSSRACGPCRAAWPWRERKTTRPARLSPSCSARRHPGHHLLVLPSSATSPRPGPSSPRAPGPSRRRAPGRSPPARTPPSSGCCAPAPAPTSPATRCASSPSPPRRRVSSEASLSSRPEWPPTATPPCPSTRPRRRRGCAWPGGWRPAAACSPGSTWGWRPPPWAPSSPPTRSSRSGATTASSRARARPSRTTPSPPR